MAFDREGYIRTLSYRDFLTAFGMALLYTAVWKVMDFTMTDFMKNVLTLPILMLAMTANHVIYRFEHKRSNNFVGRLLQDCMFCGLCLVAFKIELFLYGQGFKTVDATDFFAAVLVVLLFSLFNELVVAGFKRLLRIFKWHIL